MSDQENAAPDAALKVKPGPGPGGRVATVDDIKLISGTAIAVTLLLFYGMLKLWPHPTPAMVVNAARSDTTATRADTSRATAPTVSRTDTSAPDSVDSASRRGVDSVRTASALAGTRRLVDSAKTRPAQMHPASLLTSGGRKVPGYLWCDTVAQRQWADAHDGKEPTDQDARVDPKCASLFYVGFLLWDEQRLLLLVLLGGALGGMVHVLRSIGWYVGNRWLYRSWLVRYFLLPLVGAAIGALVYIVIRAGFFSPTTSVQDTSPFGFIAIAALMGLFSEQAVLKLKQVSETLLTPPKQGAEAAPQQTLVPGSPGAQGAVTPKVTEIQRIKDANGIPTNDFRITGSEFAPGSEVWVAGAKQTTLVVSATELRITLNPLPTAGSTQKVEVRTPGGTRSTSIDHTF